MSRQKEFVIDFEPVGRRGNARQGDSLLSAAREIGVELVSLCGGVGACDSCKIRVAGGAVNQPSLVEQSIFTVSELATGWRLACQAEPLGDVKVEIPPESLTIPQRLQLEGDVQQDRAHSPAVVALDLTMPPPTLRDLRSDSERIADAVQAAGFPAPHVSQPVMAATSDLLRQQSWSVRLAMRDDQIVAVLPAASPLLGLAIDVGTTSIAAYLVDLSTGDVLGKNGAMNPQIAYGEDVISRIMYINEHQDGQDVLQGRVVQEINRLVEMLVGEAGVDPGFIVDAVIVGNTAMHHIFAGLPVRQLGESPYVPSVGEAFTFPARQVGLLMAPGAYVYLPPVIAGYVGADHVSMQAAVDLWQAKRTTLALDIGTNTEVSLAHQGRVYCCSCASGPAFEGAHIGAGMRAAPGAIERVLWLEDKVLTKTIGHQPPVGICGSGILDTIAVMLGSGAVDGRGALRKEHPLVDTSSNGRAVFVLASAEESASDEPITVSRKDVAEIQLAKAAIRAGIEILLMEAGITATDIELFIVAGAFGTYIDIESAIVVGMFPRLPHERFKQVGNAAGMGAVLLLLSTELRRMATEAVKDIDYVELTTYVSFQDEFVRYMTF